MHRRVLTIFVASPGDLPDERTAIRDAVQHVNKVIGPRVAWYLDLRRWEEMRPGYGRAQSLINKDVDGCDLFVGILWKRWGESTGEFSSGFEEEFTRARDRRRRSKQPEIWLFFKAVADTSDPGDQLKKVMAFRNEQQNAKELFYKEYTSIEEFQTSIFDSLVEHLYELPQDLDAEDNVSRPTQTEPATTGEESGSRTGATEPLPAQLSAIFSKALAIAPTGRIADFGTVERARLLLASTSWFASGHDYVLFGVHEANLVYGCRKEWSLSAVEQRLLVRTMLANIGNVIPGWFWLSTDLHETEGLLWELALGDGNDAVRKGSAMVLAKAAHTLTIEQATALAEDALTVGAAIAFIRRSGDITFLPLLRKLAKQGDGASRRDAIEALIEIEYRQNPDRGFTTLSDMGDRVPALLRAKALALDLAVSETLLAGALESAAPAIRLFAADYMRRLGTLGAERGRRILDDPDHRVRRVGVLALLDIGEPMDLALIEKTFTRSAEAKPDTLRGIVGRGILSEDYVDYHSELLPLVFAKLSVTQLEEEIDFFALQSDVAYRVLAEEHFDYFASQIRKDVADRFEGLETRSVEKLTTRFGEDAAASIVKMWKDSTIAFVRQRHLDAALCGLAKHGDASDVSAARDILRDEKFAWRVARPAVDVIRRFGDDNDVELLLEIAKKLHDADLELTVKTALALAREPLAVAESLLYEEEPTMRRVAAMFVASQPWDEIRANVIALLSDSNDAIRMTGVGLVVRCATRDQQEELLDEYHEGETYYYNVVTGLDRAVYAPDAYARWFQGELTGFINEL